LPAPPPHRRLPRESDLARLRDDLRRGIADDDAFDALYPPAIRAASGRFWTPLSIAARASRLFSHQGARRILDLGSGAGKFCLAAAVARPDLDLIGVEQRPHLVETASLAAFRLGLDNVRFHAGDATLAPLDGIDGLYLYNPFGENRCPPSERLDFTVELSEGRYDRDVARVASLLAAARPGLVMITYHGFGGPIPATWELVRAEPTRSDWLRVWIKRQSGGDLRSFYVEEGDEVALLDTAAGTRERIPPPFGWRARPPRDG
jgi:SAM-dependent methyltransferase